MTGPSVTINLRVGRFLSISSVVGADVPRLVSVVEEFAVVSPDAVVVDVFAVSSDDVALEVFAVSIVVVVGVEVMELVEVSPDAVVPELSVKDLLTAAVSAPASVVFCVSEFGVFLL
jgi:hypothetical protein